MKTPQLTIALTKGRILKETLPLLKSANIEPIDNVFESRKLAFETNNDNVRFGVSGKDTLMEHGGDGLYTLLDLGIARCKLMTAGIKGEALPPGRIKVATKYINIARRFYAQQGRQVDLIKLYGGMELAPIMGLADEIVDIVDTRASAKKKHGLIQPLVDQIEQAIKH